MITVKNKRISFNIETEEEFLIFLVNYIKNLKSLNSDVKKFFNEDHTYTSKKILLKDVKSYFYNKTHFNEEYWLSRGWENAKDKLSEIQSKYAKKWHQKLSDMSDEKKNSYFNTNIEFYLKKGMDIEEAKKELSNRQSTFSKVKCITKYGEKEGLRIWEKRQIDWMNTMSHKNETYDKDSKSLSKFENIYGAINNNSFTDENKDLLLSCIDGDYDNFLINVSNSFTPYAINDLLFIFNSKLIQDFYGKTLEELKADLLKIYKIIKTPMGNIRYFNNHICRSNGEYHIAKFLKDNKIDYIYEKKYPNNKMICDFYIVKLDLYCEYLGFIRNDDWVTKENKRIKERYESKIRNKKLYCMKNKINFLFESDYYKIEEFIKKNI